MKSTRRSATTPTNAQSAINLWTLKTEPALSRRVKSAYYCLNYVEWQGVNPAVLYFFPWRFQGEAPTPDTARRRAGRTPIKETTIEYSNRTAGCKNTYVRTDQAPSSAPTSKGIEYSVTVGAVTFS